VVVVVVVAAAGVAISISHLLLHRIENPRRSRIIRSDSIFGFGGNRRPEFRIPSELFSFRFVPEAKRRENLEFPVSVLCSQDSGVGRMMQLLNDATPESRHCLFRVKYQFGP